MKPCYRLMLLGARYERAIQARNFDSAIRLERKIVQEATVASAVGGLWVSPWVVAGRNFVRARRGQEELNP